MYKNAHFKIAIFCYVASLIFGLGMIYLAHSLDYQNPVLIEKWFLPSTILFVLMVIGCYGANAGHMFIKYKYAISASKLRSRSQHQRRKENYIVLVGVSALIAIVFLPTIITLLYVPYTFFIYTAGRHHGELKYAFN